MNNLSTQIATTHKQSERLLAMGVKPETADMSYRYFNSEFILISYVTSQFLSSDRYGPAWSLSRLISMLPVSVPDPKPGFPPHHPELIKHELGYNLSIRQYTASCLAGTHIEQDPIECCVSMIDWLIKNNHFNKEYLV